MLLRLRLDECSMGWLSAAVIQTLSQLGEASLAALMRWTSGHGHFCVAAAGIVTTCGSKRLYTWRHQLRMVLIYLSRTASSVKALNYCAPG